MPQPDIDARIRDRAYDLWEKAGRPGGREHEHWAEARRQIEQEFSVETVPVADKAGPEAASLASSSSAETEIRRLRQALYNPEPFSFELFGDECPKTNRSIVIQNDRQASADARVAA